MEKSGDSDTTGKGWGPRKSQHPRYRSVSCIALIVIFILNSPSCALSAGVKQQSSWDRLWLAERRKKKYSFSFSLSHPLAELDSGLG